MSESDSSKPATFVLIIMVALWVMLLIAMRVGINIPSPLSIGPAQHGTAVENKRAAMDESPAPSQEDEIAGDEYDVLQQVLKEYPQLTTVFEAAMVDGKMTYSEAENILARKDALEAEAETGKRQQARERLLNTIEKLRKQ